MKSSRVFLPLAAGLLLGSGTAWSVHQLRSSSPVRGASDAAPSVAPSASQTNINAPSLTLPEPLADAEADAALDAYLALPPLAKDAPAAEIDDRVSRLQALLTLLPDSRFDRLFAALASRIGDAEARVRRAAFEIWCERAAPAAARWALAIAPGEAINAAARSRYITQAATAWARDDFASAWAWAGAIADAKLRQSLLLGLLAQLASTDPQKALALLPTGDEPLERAARRSIFQTWAERDPAAAIRGLGTSILDERGQEWSVQQVLAKWAVKDPKAALAWAAAQPPADGESYRSVLANIGWQLTNSPEAVRPFVDALLAHDDFVGRAGALQNIVGAWIRNDPQATVAWLDTVPDVALRSDLASRAFAYLEPGKPDQLLALAQRLPTEVRDQTLAQHLSAWAKKDPDAALAWLAANPAPELAAASRKVEGVLLGTLAASDPQAALARWQTLPADAPRAEIASLLALSWAKNDPAAAARWFARQLPADLAQNPAYAQQSRELGRIASGWAIRDPAGYAEWTQTLPEGIARNQALNAFDGGYQIYDGQEADPPPRAGYANQLAQIKDAALRDRVLVTHLSRWIKSDRQAARAWIESNDALSPEAAARILSADDATN